MAWVVLLLLAGAGPDATGQTALDTYVATADPSFSWSLRSTIPGADYTAYVLDMTSQTWRSSPAEVDRALWQHWVTVIVPDEVLTDTALLVIDGGNNRSSPPSRVDSDLAQGAVATNSVVVQLPTVPNQPLTFTDDGDSRREDEILAYSFDKYLHGGDDTWPALLPMVKSAVRAMDAAQAFLPVQTQGAVEVNDFVVTGASKRGWTTWLTAAVDSRVTGIMPIVIDVLNIDEQMVHHKAAYEGVDFFIVGGYSQAIEDYVEFDIPDNLHTPEAQALLGIVDPYEYRDRYSAIPKYLINATGDEFFVPDSAQFYYDDLPGEKYLRYVPNSGHGISGAVEDALLYFAAIAQGTEMPEFSWTVEDGGRTIRVTTVDEPLGVNLWQATNPESRDFRYFYGLGPTWTSSTLTGIGGEYVGQVPFPETGATAFMVELIFPGDGPYPYVFTTQVSVVVPEPSTMVLAALGSLVLLLYGCRRPANRH